MTDVSGFGLKVNIFANQTYPNGITVSQFADDSDPFDTPEIALADKAMGLNGDLVVWSKASPIEVKIAVIPDSDDDVNLQILAEQNRVGKGKQSAADRIRMQGVYPDGKILTLTAGRITNAAVAPSVASSGRKKSMVYTFAFENRTGAPG